MNIHYSDGIMKHIRIRISLTALVCMLLFASACSPKAVKPFDADSALVRLLTEVQYDSELAEVGEYAEYALVGMPDGVKIKMYSCGGGHADAVIICNVNEASELSVVRSTLKEYIASRRHDAERYDPQEVTKYDNAVWCERELCVIVCITGDAKTAEAILSGS